MMTEMRHHKHGNRGVQVCRGADELAHRETEEERGEISNRGVKHVRHPLQESSFTITAKKSNHATESVKHIDLEMEEGKQGITLSP